MSDTPVAKAAKQLVDEAGEQVRGTAKQASNAVRSSVSKAEERASAFVGDAADAAAGAVRAAESGVRDRVDQATRAARGFADDAMDTAREHPVRTALIVAGVVAGAAFLAGWLLARAD